MRHSLGAKILGSFILIVFLSLGIVVGAGNFFVRNRYDDFAVQRDLMRARSMAPMLGKWTHNAIEAVNSGLENDNRVDIDTIPWILSPSLMSRGSRVPRRGVREEDHSTIRLPQKEHVFDPLLITDTDGWVLLDTAGYDRQHYPYGKDEPEGIEIHHASDLIGYLYFGRMLPQVHPTRDISFFRYAGAATWGIAGVVFLVAIVLGGLLTRHIVNPIKRLNAVAGKVKNGVFDVRIPIFRSDEIGELAHSFNAMTESLESADKQQRRLIADSAHELRTPVSLIRARIEMMEEGVYPMDSSGLTALADETDRLITLIEGLNILATLESSNQVPEFTALDPILLINTAILAVHPSMEQSGIIVDSQVANTGNCSPVIRGEKERLHRLLTNILSNTIRKDVSQVRISFRPGDGNVVEILIEDDGPGIPEVYRKQVFERYFRVDASRNRAFGGTGLGLAICWEIVKLHKGQIFAESSQNLGGAAIRIILPTTSLQSI